MPALSKREQNKLDRQINEIVGRRCGGLPIDVLKIGDVFKAGYAAHSGVTGQDVEAAVVETYTRLSRETATRS
jgi:hypothetical protein